MLFMPNAVLHFKKEPELSLIAMGYLTSKCKSPVFAQTLYNPGKC